jgi:hypothetical protein
MRTGSNIKDNELASHKSRPESKNFCLVTYFLTGDKKWYFTIMLGERDHD